MRFLFGFLFLLAACSQAPAPSFDPLAERYVRLSLEIGTHEDGYIDAYYGPEEWKTEAEAAPRPIAELKPAVDALAAEVNTALEAQTDPLMQRRGRYLAAAIGAARFRLDMMEGTRVPFVEEAQRLFALTPTLPPLDSFDAALARIEALVPGQGPLAQRVDAFRNRYVIPPDRLKAVMDAAIAECRARTRAHLTLPDDESFTMEFVTGQSWSAYNYYEGANRSLIQVNTDLPITIDRALGLGCHEGYPGHHVQGIYAERMYRQNGWVEYSVLPLYSPQGPLGEGGGNYGVELAFPGPERLAFEQQTLYPLAGLDPATAPAFDAYAKAIGELAGARRTIAAMYLDGEIDRARALELTQRYQLMSPERADQSTRFTESYRSYVINYSSGEDVVRAYVERAGADPAARWAAYESTLNQPTLPQDLAP